jgi:hypothetical protein
MNARVALRMENHLGRWAGRTFRRLRSLQLEVVGQRYGRRVNDTKEGVPGVRVPSIKQGGNLPSGER